MDKTTQHMNQAVSDAWNSILRDVQESYLPAMKNRDEEQRIQEQWLVVLENLYIKARFQHEKEIHDVLGYSPRIEYVNGVLQGVNHAH